MFVDKAAQKGDPAKYPLPHPKVEGSPYDFSFSGLKTAVINLIHNAAQKGQEVDTDSLCASFQKTVAEILTGRLMLAADTYGYRTIVVAGASRPTAAFAPCWKTPVRNRDINCICRP